MHQAAANALCHTKIYERVERKGVNNIKVVTMFVWQSICNASGPCTHTLHFYPLNPNIYSVPVLALADTAIKRSDNTKLSSRIQIDQHESICFKWICNWMQCLPLRLYCLWEPSKESGELIHHVFNCRLLCALTQPHCHLWRCREFFVQNLIFKMCLQ